MALALGYPVRILQQLIDSREFEEWKVFKRLNPWGLERSDMNTGLLASTFANLWRGKDTPAYKISDFMLDFGKSQPVQDKKSERIKLHSDILLWAHAMNASRKKQKKVKP